MYENKSYEYYSPSRGVSKQMIPCFQIYKETKWRSSESEGAGIEMTCYDLDMVWTLA